MYLPEILSTFHTMFKAGRITRQPGTHYFILLTPDIADLDFFKDIVSKTKNVLTSHVRLVMLDPNGNTTDHLLHHVSASIPELLDSFLAWQRLDIRDTEGRDTHSPGFYEIFKDSPHSPDTSSDPLYHTFKINPGKLEDITNRLTIFRPSWGRPPANLITDSLLSDNFNTVNDNHDTESHQDWLDDASSRDIAEWLFSFLEW